MERNAETEKRIRAVYEQISLSDAHHRNYGYIFRTQFKDLFDYVMGFTEFLNDQNPKFRVRLTCVLNGVTKRLKCECPGCSNDVDMMKMRPGNPVPKHCCPACSGKDPKTDATRKKFKLEKYGDPNWNNWNKTRETVEMRKFENPNYYADREKKTKATKLRKYGSETYVNVEKSKQTRLEKYGDPNYSNHGKAAENISKWTPEHRKEVIEKRLATKEAKAAADPNYKAEIQRKSVETRKKNNGEDYTGRKKCKRTMMERYGVENAFQMESVKDGIKADNIEKYGVEYYSSTQECKDKRKETFIREYGVENVFKSEECREFIRKQNIERYGVEHNWQREDVKESIRATNMERYGVPYAIQNKEIFADSRRKYEMVCAERYGRPCYFGTDAYREYCLSVFGCENPMQNSEVRKRNSSKYDFKSIQFDSAPEVALYIWLKDNGIDFEYQPDLRFEYEYGGVQHAYFPDFRIGDTLIEIKGDQFFDSDGKMINPFRREGWTDEQYSDECGKYEAKHQCMLKNGVKILREADYSKYLNYVDSKYGKDYIKGFKRMKSCEQDSK